MAGDGQAPGAVENSQYELPMPGMMLWLSISPCWGSSPWHFNHAFLSLLLGGSSSSGPSLPGDINGYSPPTSATGWGFLGRFPTSIMAQAWGKKSLFAARLQLLPAAVDALLLQEQRALCTQPFPESRSGD